MKTIHSTGQFTLHHEGKETRITKGRNVVEDEVAAHPYVAHYLEEAPADTGTAALEEQVAALTERLLVAETQVLELSALVDAYAIDASASKKTKK